MKKNAIQKSKAVEKSIDIFNLETLEDVPSEYKKKLKITKSATPNRSVTLILELFDIKSPLTLDEMMVAFYRLYEIQKERFWFSFNLRTLQDKNLVRKVSGTKDEWEKI